MNRSALSQSKPASENASVRHPRASATTLIWDGSQARVRVARPGEVVDFDNELVKNLLAMRKAGKLAGLWIDDNRIRVRMPGDHDFEPLRSVTRPEAYAMVEEWQRVKFLTKQELSHQRMRAAGIPVNARTESLLPGANEPKRPNHA